MQQKHEQINSQNRFSILETVQSIKIKKVRLADQLLQEKNTGRAKDFARKLNISVSSLFYLIKFLKEELNAPIVFDKKTGNYRYAVEGKLIIAFIAHEDI